MPNNPPPPPKPLYVYVVLSKEPIEQLLPDNCLQHSVKLESDVQIPDDIIQEAVMDAASGVLKWYKLLKGKAPC